MYFNFMLSCLDINSLFIFGFGNDHSALKFCFCSYISVIWVPRYLDLKKTKVMRVTKTPDEPLTLTIKIDNANLEQVHQFKCITLR